MTDNQHGQINLTNADMKMYEQLTYINNDNVHIIQLVSEYSSMHNGLGYLMNTIKSPHFPLLRFIVPFIAIVLVQQIDKLHIHDKYRQRN